MLRKNLLKVIWLLSRRKAKDCANIIHSIAIEFSVYPRYNSRLVRLLSLGIPAARSKAPLSAICVSLEKKYN